MQKLQIKAGRINTGDRYEIASLRTLRTKLCWETSEEGREKQLETLMIQTMKLK